MKWCRFQLGGRVSSGLVEDDEIVEVDGEPFAEHQVGRARHRLATVKLLPPIGRAEGVDGRGPARRNDDVSQREWQKTDRTRFRAKNCDTFTPFGPFIVTGLDPTSLRIVGRHNGRV